MRQLKLKRQPQIKGDDLTMQANQPIVVIKKPRRHGGHHGGAWKVAYADFVTAMMALFIVLWLLNSGVKVKKAVAGYFNDPRSSQKETGVVKVGEEESVTGIPIDKAEREEAQGADSEGHQRSARTSRSWPSRSRSRLRRRACALN
jgi:flagellar motor protein MotB